MPESKAKGRISFVSSGGFAGIQRGVELQLDDLPEADRKQLSRLLQATRARFSGEDTKSPAMPDGMSYHFEIAESGGVKVRDFTDSDLDPQLQELVEFMNRHSKPIKF